MSLESSSLFNRRSMPQLSEQIHHKKKQTIDREPNLFFLPVLSLAMANTFSSIKDFLDDHRQHRRSSLFCVDPTDISNAAIATNGDFILTVRTAEPHQEEEAVDTSEFSPQDIDRLRAEDPFLYYSIQNNRRNRSCCDFTHDGAADDQADVSAGGSRTTNNVVDYNDFPADITTVVSRRLSLPNYVASTSSRHQTRRSSSVAIANTVNRQRRFSTETHPSLMYESLFAEVSLGELDITLDNVEEEELNITDLSMT